MRAFLVLPLLLAGCVAVPHPDAPSPGAPRFDAIRFFDGATHGDGRLSIAFHKPETTVVKGRGHIEPDGTLVLDQHVTEGSKPPRDRQWRLREVTRDRYTGTLTDAVGPVTGETNGNRLHLAFEMKGGLPTDQWLTLSADGQVAHNVLTVRKFGVTVAALDETIRRR